jgi:hypothetical protein
MGLLLDDRGDIAAAVEAYAMAVRSLDSNLIRYEIANTR